MGKRKKPLPNIEKSDIGILRYCIKVLYERDNDELVWRLIGRFGNVSGILDASFEELMRVDGMTERVATFFVVLRPLHRQALLRASSGILITDERALAEYAAVYFINDYNPYDVVVCTNRSGRILCTERLIEEERVREIAAVACRHDAAKIALLRFDPSLAHKKVLPSLERQTMLEKVLKICDVLGMMFIDYMEYHAYNFFSLRRALTTGAEIVHVKDASSEKYDGAALKDGLRLYNEECVKRLNDDDRNC